MNCRIFFMLGTALTLAAPGAVAAQDVGATQHAKEQSKSELRDELKSHFEAALLASRDADTINGSNPRYILAIEAKAHCEIALGYLRASKRDAPAIAKCRDLSDRLAAMPAEPAPFPEQGASDLITMRDAIATAMATNPEIIQAQLNKEAIEFEREQAEGRYYPTVDMELSAGARKLENTTRRTLDIANEEIYPRDVNGRADWTLLDFGRRKGELMRQVARVDGASLRALETSQQIALEVSRRYLDVLLQQRVVAASSDNTAFHRTLILDLAKGVDQGSMSIADQQQAEERLQSAIIREEQGRLDLESAQNALRRLTGLNVDEVVMPADIDAAMPPSKGDAMGAARLNNPLVREAQAEVNAADAMVKSAVGELYPTIGVDVSGRSGRDIDGFGGQTNDIQGRIYLRWNLFDGGIARARMQEMIRRASQARFRLNQTVREAEENVANSWATMQSQGRIMQTLGAQSEKSDQLLYSYRRQFIIGRRSLLDVLDAQNSRYNTQVRLETARFSQQFAEYQSLAAMSQLLDAFDLEPGEGAGENDRARFNYGPQDEPYSPLRKYP